MNTSFVETHAVACHVDFTDDELVVALVDGRKVSVPLVWFPRLTKATRSQLENYEFLDDGEGIYWPDLDEDMSVRGLLLGNH